MGNNHVEGKTLWKSIDSLIETIYDNGYLESLDIPLFKSTNINIQVLRLDRLNLNSVIKEELQQASWMPACFYAESSDRFTTPFLSGNKLFKLLPYIDQALNQDITTLLSFGGAWSNSLLAMAEAGNKFNLNTIGIVRGERSGKLSKALEDAQHLGMYLHFVSRKDYRELQQALVNDEARTLKRLGLSGQNTLCIPVGGSGSIGIHGARQLGQILARLNKTDSVDEFWLATATGGTLSGIAQVFSEQSILNKLFAIPVLADPDLPERVKHWINLTEHQTNINQIDDLIHFDCNAVCGGYAKVDEAFSLFLQRLESEYPSQVDHIYMGKVFYALWQSVAKDSNSMHADGHSRRIVILHTGGQQGRRGLINNTYTGVKNVKRS